MIRKGTALLLSALLLASAMPFAVSAEEVSAKTTEYVNFRTGPGTNYSSKDVIPSGTGITVIDTSNSEWYAVRLSDGSTGYIYAEYISVSGSNTTEDGEVNAKTTADVNFRSGPGTNYNSKAVIGSGTGIIVTDTSNSQWYAVRLTNGSTGYIYAEYIRITGDVGTPSAPAEPTPAPSNPEAEQTAKTTEYVNFRTGPGTNYSSKGVISLGTTVTVTDTSNSQWYAVRLSNGSTGYIFAQYLKLTGNTSAPTATPAPSDPANEKTAKTTEYVNFRTGPGTNYSSKGVISLGTTVTVTDTTPSGMPSALLTVPRATFSRSTSKSRVHRPQRQRLRPHRPPRRLIRLKNRPQKRRNTSTSARARAQITALRASFRPALRLP